MNAKQERFAKARVALVEAIDLFRIQCEALRESIERWDDSGSRAFQEERERLRAPVKAACEEMFQAGNALMFWFDSLHQDYEYQYPEEFKWLGMSGTHLRYWYEKTMLAMEE